MQEYAHDYRMGKIGMYISDIITMEEMQKWKKGDKVLIQAGTGCGKTTFFINNIEEYCQVHNCRALLLSNRNILKKQNEKAVSDSCERIVCKNYQAIEKMLLAKKDDLKEYLCQFSIVGLDEAHYFCSDSLFNINTNMVVDWCEKNKRQMIQVYMTATPQTLYRSMESEFKYIYKLNTDYSYIKNIVFLNDFYKDVANLIDTIPQNDKMIVFGKKMTDLFALSWANHRTGVKFVCAKENRDFGRYSDDNSVKEIISTEQFSSQVLLTTTVMDNGINIKDTALRHIAIEMDDPVSIIQCLGRKRVENKGDTVTLYLKAPSNEEVWVKNIITKRTEQSKKLMPMMARYLQYISEEYKKILKIGYRRYICEMLSSNPSAIESEENTPIQSTLTSLLFKYADRKLFIGEQEDLKKEITELISNTYKTSLSGISKISTIQDTIKKYSLPYTIERGKQTRGEFRMKRFLIIHSIRVPTN